MPSPILHFYVVKPKDARPLDADTRVHVVAAPNSADALEYLRAVPPIKGRFEARLAGTMGVGELLGTVRGATTNDVSPINTAAAIRFAAVEHSELMTPIEKATILDVADKIENRALAFMRE